MNSASERLHYFLDSRSDSAFAFLKIQHLLRAINHSWATPKREIVFFVCSSRRALYKYKLRNYGRACIGYASITRSSSDLTSLNRCLLGVTSQLRFNKLIYCSIDGRQRPLRKLGTRIGTKHFSEPNQARSRHENLLQCWTKRKTKFKALARGGEDIILYFLFKLMTLIDVDLLLHSGQSWLTALQWMFKCLLRSSSCLTTILSSNLAFNQDLNFGTQMHWIA